jgi:hypothetical protein
MCERRFADFVTKICVVLSWMLLVTWMVAGDISAEKDHVFQVSFCQKFCLFFFR